MITPITTDEIPVIGEPEDAYAQHAQNFAYAMQRIASELNAEAALENLSTTCTSASSNNLTAGDKTFTVPTGLGWASGMPGRAAVTGSSTQYADFVCKSYSGSTLVVTFGTPVGSGSGITTWTITKAANASNVASLGSNNFTGAQNFAQGADLVAASTVNLDTMTGNSGRITGNTTITAFTLSNGRTRDMVIMGTPLLVFNATTNNLNSNGLNYQCIGGERLTIAADSSIVRVSIITPDGRALNSPASNQSLIDYAGRGISSASLNPISFQSAGSNLADSKKGTLFVNLRFQNNASSLEAIFAGSATNILVARTAAGDISIAAKNAAGTVILDVTTTNNPCFLAGNYSIMASWDLAVPGSGKLFINNNSNYSQTTFTNDTVDYTVTDYNIGGIPPASNIFNGDLYVFFFDETANVDFSVPDNRLKFLDNSAKVVFMGINGELPLGFAPAMFFGYSDELTVGFNTPRGRTVYPSAGGSSYWPATVRTLGHYSSAIDPTFGLKVTLKQDVVLATTSLEVIGGNGSGNGVNFGFLAKAGKTYKIRAVLFYDAAATGTGARFVLFSNPGLASYSRVALRITQTLAATTEVINTVTGVDLPAGASLTSLLTGNIAIIEGFITASTNSKVIFAGASEVGASAITVLKGSTLEFQEV